LNLRKFVYGNRVVDYWNGLSDSRVNCSTINDFKSKSRTGTTITVLTVVMYDSRLIWHEPVPTHAISA